MKRISGVKIFFLFYLPLFIWMGVIFAFSAYRGYAPHSGELPWGQWLLRKGAHVLEYAVLALCIFRVVWWHLRDRAFLVFFVTGFFSLLYAITDEIHQYFVPLRQGKLSDVLIDCLGIFLTLLVLFVLWRKEQKKKGRLFP